MALTKRQKQILDVIDSFVTEKGYSPSYDEIAQMMNLASLATVHKHISALESKGYLRRSFNRSRSLELTPKYHQEVRRRPAARYEVPLAGRIAAGSPVEAFEGPESLSFADFAGHNDTFALQVRGDSMIEDHILDGDYVLVERTQHVQDGDVVVALVGGAETTLKRIYLEPDEMVRLQPANRDMEPIVLPAEQVQIQGRLIAVLRKYR